MTRKPPPRPATPADVVARAVEMYAAGMGSEAVGAELGISGTTVTEYARKAGVPIRTKAGRDRRHEEHALTGGRWVVVRGVRRWVPDGERVA